MVLPDFIKDFKCREAASDPVQANWYIIAAAALAASSASPDIPALYAIATTGLSLKDEKLVQRRFKEAILKTSALYGIPRSLQALLALFANLRDEQIDHYGPRTEALETDKDGKIREERGRKYFDLTWTPELAQVHRDTLFKYQPDLYLMNLKSAYENYFSEDQIINNIETQLCNTAALICSNCETQALWHTRGIVRHGGSVEQAEFAQELGLKIAEYYGAKTGSIMRVADMDWNDTTSPFHKPKE